MAVELGIIDCPEFLELVRRAWMAPLRRSDVTEDFVPRGYTPDQVWDALSKVRHAQAFRSPQNMRTNPGITSNWHNVTEQQHRTLSQLEAATHKGSDLDKLIVDRESTSFITQQYVEEIVSNLAYDGFEAAYEDVRTVLLAERGPVGDAEHIALNFHGIMRDLGGRYATRDFDVAVLEELYGALLDGVQASDGSVVDAGSLLEPARLAPRSPLEEHYVRTATPESVDAASLQMPIDVANGVMSEPARHPIMVSMLVNCQFWRAPLFPSCNNLMGCIASRLYLVREGYPVFRYVPKIRILEKWKHGMYEGAASCTYAQALASADDDMDWTLYYDNVMALMLREVQAMERSLLHRAAADDDAIAGIDRVPYLSYRQRDILRQAVLVPDGEFYIAAHQKRYGVAYSTARADLEKLVEAGYLTRVIQGQAYAYRAARNLRSILAG